MKRKLHTPSSRRLAQTLKNSAKAERHLSHVERVHGAAHAWEQRQRLERGDISLKELRAF